MQNVRYYHRKGQGLSLRERNGNDYKSALIAVTRLQIQVVNLLDTCLTL
jgi:hypothetical protein